MGKTILVDMDDTIEDLTTQWVYYANERFSTNVSPDDLRDWDMSLAWPELTHKQVYDIQLEHPLYDRVRPLPGAPEALKRLIDEGNRVVIVTNTPYQIVPVKMDKVLFKYFPYLTWNDVILTRNKQMIRGDILVDDGPHNLRGGAYEKLLFTMPHNRELDAEAEGMIRVNNWDEAYAEIEKILSRD